MDFIITQYIEINLIGLVILAIMLVYCIYHKAETKSHRIFMGLVLCDMLVLFSDIVIYLLRYNNASWAFTANHISCIVYYLFQIAFGYLWLKFCIVKLFPEYEPKKALKFILTLPMLICTAMIILSPFTGWVYSLTALNHYKRGPLLVVIILLAYLYWLAGGILTIREIIVQKRNREKGMYFSLLIFPIPTLIANIVQIKFYGLSVIWISAAISLLIIFIDSQSAQANRDHLTGLYNRRKANNQIEWEINHATDSTCLVAIMLDVDSFKKINDNFGHVVGDRALVCVADILNNTVPKNVFLSRFAGDEFFIVGHAKGEDEIKKFISVINKKAVEFNNECSEPFNLSFSIGYKIFEKKDNLSVDKIISEADKDMYRIKQAKKNIK